MKAQLSISNVCEGLHFLSTAHPPRYLVTAFADNGPCFEGRTQCVNKSATDWSKSHSTSHRSHSVFDFLFGKHMDSGADLILCTGSALQAVGGEIIIVFDRAKSVFRLCGSFRSLDDKFLTK